MQYTDTYEDKTPIYIRLKKGLKNISPCGSLDSSPLILEKQKQQQKQTKKQGKLLQASEANRQHP